MMHNVTDSAIEESSLLTMLVTVARRGAAFRNLWRQ